MFAKITLSFSKSDLMISEINIFEKTMTALKSDSKT